MNPYSHDFMPGQGQGFSEFTPGRGNTNALNTSADSFVPYQFTPSSLDQSAATFHPASMGTQHQMGTPDALNASSATFAPGSATHQTPARQSLYFGDSNGYASQTGYDQSYGQQQQSSAAEPAAVPEFVPGAGGEEFFPREQFSNEFMQPNPYEYDQQGVAGVGMPSYDTGVNAAVAQAAADAGWVSSGSIMDSSCLQPSPISCIACDPMQEVVWTGAADGRFTGLTYEPDAARCCSLHAHSSGIWQLKTGFDSILSLSSATLFLHSKGGMEMDKYTLPGQTGMRAVELTQPNTAIVGGDGCKPCMLDLSTGSIVTASGAGPSDCTALASSNGGFLVAGGGDGCIYTIDPSSLHVRHCTAACSGNILDIAVWGNQVISLGASKGPGGAYFPDGFVRIHDIRKSSQPLLSIQSPVPPMRLKMMPHFGSFVTMASDGTLQMYDVAAAAPTANSFGTGTASMATSIDVSSNGRVIVVGDSEGVVQCWSEIRSLGNGDADATLNDEVNFPTLPAKPAQVFEELREDRLSGRLAMGFVPDGGTQVDALVGWRGVPGVEKAIENDEYATDTILASQWPKEWPVCLANGYSAQPPVIDSKLLQQATYHDFVGYVANPGIKRGFERQGISSLSALTGVASPKKVVKSADASKQGQSSTNPDQDQHDDAEPADEPCLWDNVDQLLRPLRIHAGRYGIDDFPFSSFNSTRFPALENSGPNSWCNSLLQALYLIRPLRAHIVNHMCNREACLCCELANLFVMLTHAQGRNVHATNFFRALRQLPEAVALELIDPSEAHGGATRLKLLPRIFKFVTYVLDQLNKESKASPSGDLIDAMFGFEEVVQSKCLGCSHAKVSNRHSSVCRVAYPYRRRIPGERRPSCGVPCDSSDDLLANALNSKSSQPRAFCPQCKEYHQLEVARTVTSLPSILVVESGIKGPGGPGCDAWKGGPGWWKDSTMVRKPSSPISDAAENRSDGYIKVGSAAAGAPSNGDLLAKYELTHVVCTAFGNGSEDARPGHAVLFSRVSPDGELMEDDGSSNGPWTAINDFGCTTGLRLHEVLTTSDDVVPAILLYCRADLEDLAPPPSPHPFPPKKAFAQDHSLSIHSTRIPQFRPPSEEELRRRHVLVGIDAEFVSLNAEEARLQLDGTSSIIRESRLSLGRVSVIREDGSAMVDDYIKTPEPVMDYLTRWSGLTAADLNVETSHRHIIPLKRAYLKLRAMVDQEWIFVGHGLKKDFRIINIFVPEQNIKDTVKLFWLPGRRFLSLRFLAYHLLKSNVQVDTHDSIEDSLTAMALYKKYLSLANEGSLESVLHRLYDIGRETAWKIPPAVPLPPDAVLP